jgi:hypothetical protein
VVLLVTRAWQRNPVSVLRSFRPKMRAAVLGGPAAAGAPSGWQLSGGPTSRSKASVVAPLSTLQLKAVSPTLGLCWSNARASNTRCWGIAREEKK